MSPSRRTPPLTALPIREALDLPAPLKPAEALSGACSQAHEIAGRILRLQSWRDGDELQRTLRAAAAELTRIADTLTTDRPWPLGGLDGG